ncbi:MAG: ATP-binding protein [Firmicutes bacterium HGW-Firmicutes-11]|jgi:hypothetical protein|nr:MAG: ATP-binding protein [Firmicutes bacterium HGW-Firmicutes-11]
MKRITIVTGHYGSGKTEFSVNLALHQSNAGKRTALVDLDIANVYFRSREQRALLESNGIQVYGGSFDYEITAELPALSSSIRKPLEDPDCLTVVDVGGNDSGARILKQFAKYFTPEQSEHLIVINGNRPETSTLEGALLHIEQIQRETGLPVDGLVNNTHLLMETEAEHIQAGIRFCNALAEKSGIPVRYHCCAEDLCEKVFDGMFRNIDPGIRFPMKIYMRPTWLDR